MMTNFHKKHGYLVNVKKVEGRIHSDWNPNMLSAQVFRDSTECAKTLDRYFSTANAANIKLVPVFMP